MDKDFFERNAERVRSMSQQEVGKLLKEAGVVDADGHLAQRYRPPPQAQTAETAAGAGGQD